MSRPTNLNQKLKSGNSSAPRAAQLKKAPPVYRPQPVPKVLQTKASPQNNSTAGSMVQLNGVIQNKTKSAPPAYRPNPTPLVLQMKTSRHVHTPPARLMVPVIQRMEEGGGRSSSNAFVYSSLGQSYTPEQIEDAQQEALGQNVHGHQTGGSNSNQSQQTKTEMAKVVDVLRKNKEKEKRKKKLVSRDKAPMTGFQKARKKAETIFAAKGKDGLGDFCEYLDTRSIELGLTEQEADQLVDLFK
jgi:hypothetical protein